jgi:hypothetical protein
MRWKGTCSFLAKFKSRARIDAAISFMTLASDAFGQALRISEPVSIR